MANADDELNSAKKVLEQTILERISSPLIGGFIASWCVWNWRAIAYFFGSNDDIPIRIDLVQRSYLDHWFSNWGGPLIVALIYSLIYPYIGLGIAYIVAGADRRKNAIRMGELQATREIEKGFSNSEEWMKLKEDENTLSEKRREFEKSLRQLNQQQQAFEEQSTKLNSNIRSLEDRVSKIVGFEFSLSDNDSFERAKEHIGSVLQETETTADDGDTSSIRDNEPIDVEDLNRVSTDLQKNAEVVARHVGSLSEYAFKLLHKRLRLSGPLVDNGRKRRDYFRKFLSDRFNSQALETLLRAFSGNQDLLVEFLKGGTSPEHILKLVEEYNVPPRVLEFLYGSDSRFAYTLDILERGVFIEEILYSVCTELDLHEVLIDIKRGTSMSGIYALHDLTPSDSLPPAVRAFYTRPIFSGFLMRLDVYIAKGDSFAILDVILPLFNSEEQDVGYTEASPEPPPAPSV